MTRCDNAMPPTRAQVGHEPRDARAGPADPKKALIFSKLVRQRRKGARPETIPVRPTGVPPPMSLSQQRLWFLTRMEPGSTVYNVPLAVGLNGPLNSEALIRSLNQLIQRHLTLRTRFSVANGLPQADLSEQLDLELETLDVRDHSASDRMTMRLNTASEWFARPFDLSLQYPVRARLILESDHQSVLLLSFHHIAIDGWSRRVLMRDLAALYRGALAGVSDPGLPELRIDYGDFAAWQHARLESGALDGQIRYWKERLGNGLPTLDLPTDFPRPVQRSHRGGMVSFRLDSSTMAPLRALCLAQGATQFMGLLAVFKIILSRYCYQTDVPVGTAVANRTLQDIEPLVGFFVNTLVLRTELAGAGTFNTVLARVKETALGAFANQDVPFEKLVEMLNPSRDTSRNPLFQVFCNLVDMPEPQIDQGADPSVVTFNRLDLDHRIESKFDLSLDVRIDGDACIGRLIYSLDLFEPATIEGMATAFQTLLRQVSIQPDAPLAVLTAGIQQGVDLNCAVPATFRPAPRFDEAPPSHPGATVSQRFTNVARVCGDRAAVQTGDVTVSYGALEACVDAVAEALAIRTSDGDGPVALLFGHGEHGPLAMLAALRAGRTFVAMDPSHPHDRLAFMLADSGASLVMTNRFGRERIDGLDGSRPDTLLIEDLLVRHRTDTRSPPAETEPNHPAYLLYTSGSTGRPKAVIQTSEGLMHFMRVYRENLRIGPGDRLLWISSFAFDATLMDVFGALLSGATLQPFDLRQDGLGALRTVLRDGQTTVFHSTPTVFRMLCATLDTPEDIPHLRLVVLGGEETRSSDVTLFQRHFPQSCVLVNGYGPTEASVCMQQFVDHAFDSASGVPMGAPLPGIGIELRAPDGAPAPRVGELVLRSRHVARGYLHHPDETARAFPGGPDQNGARAYLTGDLAELRSGRHLLFRGRGDSQVKVRGQRVECGEVEAALVELEPVAEAAVVAATDRDGNARLVAYVSPADGQSMDAASLLSSLGRMLPEYMVPSQLQVLHALPRNANGKLDRRALPKPPDPITDVLTGRTEPVSDTERELQTVFAALLGVSVVPLDRGFFELGGHSLMAVRLFWEIEQRFGRNLPLSTLYRAPTVESLAREIAGGDGPVIPETVVEIRPGTGGRPFFCVHGVAGNILFVRSLALRLSGHGSVYGIQPPMLDGSRSPFQSVEAMAQHYVGAIRAVQPRGPYRLGGFSFGGTVALEMARQLCEVGEAIEWLVIFDSKAPRCDRSARLVESAVAVSRTNLPLARKLRRASRRWRKATHKNVSRLCHRALGEWYLRRGKAVPVTLRNYHIAAECIRLARRYRGRTVDAPVALICSQDRLAQLSVEWRRFTTGPLEIRCVPGQHKEMFDEVNVASLAEALTPFLGPT